MRHTWPHPASPAPVRVKVTVTAARKQSSGKFTGVAKGLITPLRWRLKQAMWSASVAWGASDVMEEADLSDQSTPVCLCVYARACAVHGRACVCATETRSRSSNSRSSNIWR